MWFNSGNLQGPPPEEKKRKAPGPFCKLWENNGPVNKRPVGKGFLLGYSEILVTNLFDGTQASTGKEIPVKALPGLTAQYIQIFGVSTLRTWGLDPLLLGGQMLP